MKDTYILVKDVLPDLADEIKKVFEKNNRTDLCEQLDNLKVISLCDCNQEDCGSFFTIPAPSEEEDLNVEGFIIAGAKASVEIIEGRIGYIEIFPSEYGREVHNKLAKLLGDDQF